MSPNGTQAVQQRVQLANWQKNYQNAVVMDAEDDWDHKQLSFAGLAEAMGQIRMQVAADMRMPMTKLFGISAAGFNSGEDDIEVYNAMVESQVRGKLKYDLLRMLEVKCQKLFGFVPDDLTLAFKPLRVMSSEQEENVKTQKFTRLIQAKQAGELTTEEFRDACNKGGLFDVTLDASDAAISDLQDEAAEKADAARAAMGGEEEEEEDDEDGDDEDILRSVNQLRPYTSLERMERVIKNSAAFDRASYEADGGDKWIDPRRKDFFDDPENYDQELWAKAEDAAKKAGGDWQMAVWLYRKLGGRV